jgi:drug/metabolite transporter (DMT)-like permease
MVLVGSTVVVSKLIGQDVEPFLATTLRHALALPVFLLMMRASGARFARVSLRDALLLLVQAAAGSVGYSVLLIQGVSLASASDASIITGTLPAVAALFAVALLGERPGVRMALSIALATAGVMAVTLTPQASSHASARLQGMLLVLGAIACEAVFILANKRLSRPVPALALSTLMCAGGLLLSAAPAWFAAQASPSILGAAAWLGVAYYAWVPTVGGFLLWYAGSARTSGAGASLATVWLPVSALLLSALFLGEAIHAWQWVGLACVVLAIQIGSRGERASAIGHRRRQRQWAPD